MSSTVFANTKLALAHRVALRWAEKGWRVLPVHEDKRPDLPHWDDEASTDPTWIDQVFCGWTGGVGAIPPVGVLTLDWDVRDRKGRTKPGLAQLSELEDYLGELVSHQTLTRRTRSGGRHIIGRIDTSQPLDRSGIAAALGVPLSKLALDLRGGDNVCPGAGGYIVVHMPDRSYRDEPLSTSEIFDFSNHLVELLTVGAGAELPDGGNTPQHKEGGSGDPERVRDGTESLPAGVAEYWSRAGGDKSLHAYYGIRICLESDWTTEEIIAELMGREWPVLATYRQGTAPSRVERRVRLDVERIAEKLAGGLLSSSDDRGPAEQLASLHDAMQRAEATKLWNRQPIAERVLLDLMSVSAEIKSLTVGRSTLTLARQCSASENSVTRALKVLKESGWLRVHTQGSARQATVYRLSVPAGLRAGKREQVQRVQSVEGGWTALFTPGGYPRTWLRVLERLLTGVVETRAELAAATGLNAGSVSKAVGAFIKELEVAAEVDGRAVALVVDQAELVRICRARARALGVLKRVRDRNEELRGQQWIWSQVRELHNETAITELAIAAQEDADQQRRDADEELDLMVEIGF